MPTLVAADADLCAVGAGLLAHAVWRRREPIPSTVVLTTLLALAGSTAYGIKIQDLVPIDAALLAVRLVGLGLTALLISISVYRLGFWHPLSSVPGPIAARLTTLYMLRYVVAGTTRLKIKKLHDKYGDLVRIGPNELSVRRADAILQLTGAHSWIKGVSYDVTLSGGGSAGAPAAETSLISLRDHTLHATRRRYWDRAFSGTALKGYQNAIVDRIVQFCDLLDGRQGQEIDMHKHLGFLVYDVLTDLAYGGGGKMLAEGQDPDDVLHTLSEAFNYSGIIKATPWIGSVIGPLGFGHHANGFRDFAKKQFIRRHAQGRKSADPDIFMHLLGEEAHKSGTPQLSQRELASDSALVIAAGADTTRTVLSTIFMHMLRNPWRFKQLQKELDRVLGPANNKGRVDVPVHDELVKIELIDAYINESLRLNPPLPFAIQREVPEEGQELAGHMLPGGAQVRLAIYAIHRDPRHFSEPDEFKPERWYANDPEGTCDKAAFTPFIYGPYHCPGKQFAYQEMRLLLATILRRYDIVEAPGFDSVAFEKSFVDRAIVDIPTALRVVLKQRNTVA